MIQVPTLNKPSSGRLPLAEAVLVSLLIKSCFLRYYKRALVVTFATLGTVVLLQLVYPQGRMLPFSRMEGQAVGFADMSRINRLLDAKEAQVVKITASSKTYQPLVSELGVQMQALPSATSYPLSARLVPFSAVAYARHNTAMHVRTDLDEAKARAYLKQIIDENTRAAVEGSIKVEGVNIILVEPQAGAKYNEGQIVERLRKFSVADTASFTLPTTTTDPAHSKQALQAAVSRANSFIGQDIVVQAVGSKQTISRQTIASALRFVPQPDGAVAVQLDQTSLNEALKPLASKVYIAPTSTYVVLRDGAEISRSGGSAGRALSAQAVAALTQTIERGDNQLTLTTDPVAPATNVSRTYSKTNQGLQALINDWMAENRAPRWSVVVKEMGGLGRTASIKPDDRYVTASVYKLFLASPVLTAVDNGSLNLNTATSTGKTVDVCIEQMIVISSNPCSHALGDMLGWGSVTSALHAKGFGATTLSMEAGFYSTANDAAKALEQLHYGSYVPGSQRDRLLDMMRRQVFRTGIPAGSRGIAVADKVGYVDGYRHDAAIVYHPNGPYILSVFSYYGRDPQIANLASRLNAYFNQ